MEIKSIEADFVCDISRELAEGELVAFSCQNNRQVIFATAQKELDYREERSHGSFAKTTSKAGQDYSVYLVNEDQSILLCDVVNEPYNIHFAQLLGNDSLLLSCARSRYKNQDKFDHNGRLYSLDGKFQSELLLGDGIQDLQVSSRGVIWTSYFDEGVLGNYGWDNPVGASGLIAWDKLGRKRYEYNPEQGLDHILDCYAFNLEADEIAWFYYYTEFQLVKIKGYQVVDYWNIPVSGSDSFAVYRNFALFHGGYDDKEHLYLVQLKQDHKAKTLYKIQLTNISVLDWVIARGDTMFILSGDMIYKVELARLLG
ncbi:MAG: hypothetical protein AB2588_17765 [Candidatus Thiodiazotropha sp.]